MVFDIYGRFELEVVLKNNRWVAFRRSNGLLAPYRDLVFPVGIRESELLNFVDDFFHEYAREGQYVRVV